MRLEGFGVGFVWGGLKGRWGERLWDVKMRQGWKDGGIATRGAQPFTKKKKVCIVPVQALPIHSRNRRQEQHPRPRSHR